MKKIVFMLLAAVTVLSGCISNTLSQRRNSPVPDKEAANAIVSKVKSDIDTHTIEGFTGQSTYADCAAKIEAEMAGSQEISYGFGGAELKYNCELLGYPADLEFGFHSEDDKQILGSLCFIIYPGEGSGSGSEKVLMEKLRDELGGYRKISNDDVTYYSWESDEWTADLVFQGENDEPGCLATIIVYPSESFLDGAVDIPEMFHFRLGTDIAEVFRGESPLMQPESGTYSYSDGDIGINMRFEADETGALRLSGAEYCFSIGNTGLKESLGYNESLADGLESATGKPDSRGYILPDADGYIMWFGPGLREGCSAEDVLESGIEEYRFSMEWPGISFDSGSDTRACLNFSREYFNGGSETPEAEEENAKQLEYFLKRVQNNADTGTFEGFTKENTFWEAAESACMELDYAAAIFAVDFPASPAYIYYSYAPSRGELMFDVFTEERTGYEEKITYLLDRLDDTLGRRIVREMSNDEQQFYQWQPGTYPVNLQTKPSDLESIGELAIIFIGHPDKGLSLSKIPDIFCSLFGAEFDAGYDNEIQALLNSKDPVYNCFLLEYIVDGISIGFDFRRDKEYKNVILYNGYYTFTADIKGAGPAADYMEAFMDGSQRILGKPYSRGYGYPGGSAETAREIKQQECDEFWSYSKWEGSTLSISYQKGSGVAVRFNFDIRNF